MFTVPTSTEADVLANVTDQVADPGTLSVVALIIGIPLFFYVVRRLKGLFPSA